MPQWIAEQENLYISIKLKLDHFNTWVGECFDHTGVLSCLMVLQIVLFILAKNVITMTIIILVRVMLSSEYLIRI